MKRYEKLIEFIDGAEIDGLTKDQATEEIKKLVVKGLIDQNYEYENEKASYLLSLLFEWDITSLGEPFWRRLRHCFILEGN